MASLIRSKRSRQIYAFVLAVCFFMLSLPGAAVAADQPDEEIELKRSDFNKVNDAETGDRPSPADVRKNTDSQSPQSKPASDLKNDKKEPGGKDTEPPPDPTPAEDEAASRSTPQHLTPESESHFIVPSTTGGTPNGDENVTTGSSGRAPFNLGIRKSVIDLGAGEDNVNLQGGASGMGLRGGVNGGNLQGGTATIGSQFPTLDGSANQAGLKGGAGTTTLSGGLTQIQLQRLAQHDLVLIIDQSSSMQTPDCPASGLGRVGGTVMGMLLGSAACVSRWNWCREQTIHLAEQTRYVSAKGMSVVLFAGNFAIFPHVTVDQIPIIFRQAKPQGGTNLTDPIRATIADYFNRKKLTGGNVKPLAIAIITDGLPNNEVTVCQALVEATTFMKDPNEIKVTFFLIGNSAYTGQAFVNELEKNLPRYGGRYNIVRAVSFWNLMKVGLSRALADALE